MKIIIRLFLVFVIGAFGLYQYYQYSLKPTPPGEATIIEIPQGSSSKQIATLLEQNGIIKNERAFLMYLRQTGKGTQLQAGRYQLSPGESVKQVVDRLANGEVFLETVEVTIPEGWTVKQIGALLSEKGLVDEQKFYDEINNGSFSYPFVEEIPPSLPYRLEGYLFPKTYSFHKDQTEHEIINQMLIQFDREYDQDWQDKLDELNLSVHEVVTLASIIEREVAVAKERPIVAAVYLNRMEIGMLLQADATIQYALGEQKDRLTYKDLELDHPYNTYIHDGLPPGPIAAPGKSALEAVARPDQHDYLFYVTKKDGSGEHFFSKTYQEHLRNIALSNQSSP